MRGPGGSSNNKKYSLNFNVQALNLFNDIDLGKPVGEIQPTFNSSTGLYGPGNQVRQVERACRRDFLH